MMILEEHINQTIQKSSLLIVIYYLWKAKWKKFKLKMAPGAIFIIQDVKIILLKILGQIWGKFSYKVRPNSTKPLLMKSLKALKIHIVLIQSYLLGFGEVKLLA